MSKKTILVFGGNGFIGAEVVTYLLDHNLNEYDIILVNRGHWDDWDTATRIRSRVTKTIVCDRKKESLVDKLAKYLEQDDFQFEAVIDFSAYKSRVIKNALRDIPTNKIKLYILISTDSVYEVSQFDQSNKLNGEYYSKETDSVRPVLESDQKKLKEFDSYGHHKFKCEEKLVELSKDKFPYAILRLPDVIGPRDSTNRVWLYQMLLQYLNHTSPNEPHEIIVPKAIFTKRTSYVYVIDVAIVIQRLLQGDIKNEVFNIGCKQDVLLCDFLRIMASIIRPGLEETLVFKRSDSDARPLYSFLLDEMPSVTKGPISIDKAKATLDFEPCDLTQMLRETVEFYNEAYKKFPRMRKMIEKDIRCSLLKTEEEKLAFEKFISDFTN